MSEKSLWEWLNRKMAEVRCEWRGIRVENCSNKGIPDSFVSFSLDGITYSGHLELKDWSVPKKHPLSREQFNFIGLFGGAVFISDNEGGVILCHKELHPLMVSDLNYAKRTGEYYSKKNFGFKFVEDLSKIFPGKKL